MNLARSSKTRSKEVCTNGKVNQAFSETLEFTIADLPELHRLKQAAANTCVEYHLRRFGYSEGAVGFKFSCSASSQFQGTFLSWRIIREANTKDATAIALFLALAERSKFRVQQRKQHS